MRTTEFWDRMRAQFGEVYAQSLAKDYVLASLGDRTVERALADGEDVKVVWRAVADAFNVPENKRLDQKRFLSERPWCIPRDLLALRAASCRGG